MNNIIIIHERTLKNILSKQDAGPKISSDEADRIYPRQYTKIK